MSRAQEIRFINHDDRPEWLADQMDELGRSIDRLSDKLDKLTTVLTGLLISVCVALIAIPSFVFFRT